MILHCAVQRRAKDNAASSRVGVAFRNQVNAGFSPAFPIDTFGPGMPKVGCQVLSLVPVGFGMWGQFITCHNLHHPSLLATLVGIAGRFRLGES